VGRRKSTERSGHNALPKELWLKLTDTRQRTLSRGNGLSVLNSVTQIQQARLRSAHQAGETGENYRDERPRSRSVRTSKWNWTTRGQASWQTTSSPPHPR
jgi:hypothetical protein